MAICTASSRLARWDVYLETHMRLDTRVESIKEWRNAQLSADQVLEITGFKVNPKGRPRPSRIERLRALVEKSPKLEETLRDMEYVLPHPDHPATRLNKLLITEEYPLIAWYWELVLNFLHIATQTLHSGLDQDERARVVTEFRKGPRGGDLNHLSVCILMYTRGGLTGGAVGALSSAEVEGDKALHAKRRQQPVQPVTISAPKMSLQPCCVKGFEWDGTPEGKAIPFPTFSNQAYVTGSNSDAAVMLITDVFGWDFINNRLLADHFAREANVTVYMPDFLSKDILKMDFPDWAKNGLDIQAFISKHSRDIREPEIFACARKLRSEYKKLGASGYCYGGWAVCRLGAKGNDLVDCISMGHPSMLVEADLDGVAVPIQILAPEIDPAYTDELKEHTWKTLQKNGVVFGYEHFPGVEHSCFTRGDPGKAGELEAMVRGKSAAVGWFRQWLHPA
ncbi:hypothetical protein B0A55_06640 [Friedmanniomyces simplex]|uniref:Dienelactone hydrolase domain-containing protein n=1 Tax=Friedmanniomyces simplex TaxID=329884 RepID=A0A4U0XK90_9PEZI|nr:hypothetical protein B0A55_06640 [Friedmanniomyces simplex]